MGLTQLLSYHKTFQIKKRLTRLKKPLLLAFLASIIASFLFSFGPSDWQYALLLFAALFAMAANLSWLVSLVKRNTLQAGAAISHLGFALLIVGALLSNARKTPISHNADKFDLQMLDESFLNNENVLLRKGDTVKMNNYYITYRGKKKEGVNIYYDIGYYEAVLDHEDMRWQRGDSLFSLTPSIQQNEKFGNVSEPDTRHYWSHDVFTHVKWADTEIHHADHPDDDFMNRILKEVQLGKKYQHDNLLIAFNDIYLLNSITEKEELGLHENDVVVQADFSLSDVTDAGKKDVLSPIFIVKDSVSIYSQAAYSDLLQVELDIQRLTKQPNTVVLSIREKEYLVMQALIFPGMNLLWTGCIVMIAGMGLVLYRRWSEYGKSV
jgi:cytochrome c-type biogenesis protein CcmF